MSHVLVTGGNGFIGSHLVDKLAATKLHDVTVLDIYPRSYEMMPEGVTFIQGDIRDAALTQRLIVDRGIDVVYHTAWMSIHETSLQDPIADVERNLIPAVHLLEACRSGGVKRVIYISSGGTVYGVPKRLPVKECHPTNPISPYGVTKLAVEKYLQMYCHLYGIEYVIFRPSVPYGPRQNPLRRQGAVSVFIHRALHGEPVVIWGDGGSLRDYFYIDDLSQALVSVVNRPIKASSIINLAGSKGYTLVQLIAVIEETLNIEIKIKYEAARKFDVLQLQLDINLAKTILKWKPEVSLNLGIKRTAEWIKKWVPNGIPGK